MKFIFANNFYYLRGGSERVFFDEIELLEANGHVVAPFTRQFEKNLPSPYSAYFAGQFDYENVSAAGKASAALKLIYSKEAAGRLRVLIKAFKPDLLHAHNVYGRLTASIFGAAEASGVPALLTLHDYKLICPSYLMLRAGTVCEACMQGDFYNCLFSRCHKGSVTASLIYTAESYFNRVFKKYSSVMRFISPSEFLLKKHVEAGMPEDKFAHIPNFVRPDEFEPAFGTGAYALFVGRLSREKGVLTLIKAAKGLGIEVRVVGEGPMKDDYVTYVRENGIKNVSFEGHRSGQELKGLFRGAMFTVIPSEWYENAPMTVLEAFAYGKPVIGADIGGIPEMVEDGKTGFLFKSGAHEELRERVDYLSKNPSLVVEMGMNARKKVEAEHSPEAHYRKLMDVYGKTAA